ncbi:MAG TPA: hydrogenase maturation nickel metallochaperone HypA [Tepidisphaeraceae bacterium]|nr:hydrogenase maturation nickel metallochaperone HypA [Tepidisphaeraceae bacterium]
MHELSIALSMLELVEAEAERRGGVRVTSIHLKLGALSGVVKEALVSAYELAREGTPLAECGLVIEDVPIRVYCPTCRAQRDVPSIYEIRCATCGTPTADIVSGREMEISAMEICE